MKLIKSFYAVILMLLSLRIFSIKKNFKNKRVAIVGAADSVFDKKSGGVIDSYDIVIRINKAAQVWDEKQSDYLGTKFTFLFHSFFENNYSGGGPIDLKRFEDLGIQKIIHPNSDIKGLIAHLNFYKRHLKCVKTYIFSPLLYNKITKSLFGFQPTVGFSTVYSVLNTECKEVYLTGFTFFKTPYVQGYRDELGDKKINDEHIRKQGIHNPEMEFKVFKALLQKSKSRKIILDSRLQKLIE
ncbi:glycosyltransferase family 29 protein [Salegentibacter sp. LM13S]|uniref:glycosyltransferase family 29 protein n=1 Tax=Salegentibacter lacus TaxID=2873599 RepID=UPI001CC9F326|nr:glycosyltransferase family 29 protein [Salegentibacter lacus]MBZ9631472.1 glycosyltransferase family 29 protein [Salegentibacter lacus]